jgi:AraC-like DNA-binding protein
MSNLTLSEVQVSQFKEIREESRCLEQFPVFATTAAVVAHRYMSRTLAPHRLNIAAGVALNAALHHRQIGSLSVLLLRYGARVRITPGANRSHVLFQVVLSGASEIEVDGVTMRAPAGCGIILETLERSRLSWSEDCEQIIIPIPRLAFSTAFHAATGRGAPDTFGFRSVFQIEETGNATAHLVRYVLAQTASSSPLRSMDEPLQTLLANELISTYSGVAPSNAGKRSPLPGYICRAEDFMAANLQRKLTLRMIASAAKVPSRTLAYGFRRFRNDSPFGILREMRLNGARKMLNGNALCSVTEVALHFRFDHVGRFASYYKQFFGELPSQTANLRVGGRDRLTRP